MGSILQVTESKIDGPRSADHMGSSRLYRWIHTLNSSGQTMKHLTRLWCSVREVRHVQKAWKDRQHFEELKAPSSSGKTYAAACWLT